MSNIFGTGDTKAMQNVIDAAIKCESGPEFGRYGSPHLPDYSVYSPKTTKK